MPYPGDFFSLNEQTQVADREETRLSSPSPCLNK